jgi:hypothetical protein
MKRKSKKQSVGELLNNIDKKTSRQLIDDMLIYGQCVYRKDADGKITRMSPLIDIENLENEITKDVL